MSIVQRIRRWFERTGDHQPGSTRSADPADLHPGTDAPADAAAHSGLDRPFPDAGPVADPPVGDPPPAQPPDRPMG